MGYGFYRSKDPTNSIKVLKETAQRTEAKYATLQEIHLFQPVVVESLGTVEEATLFVKLLMFFLFQRVSVLVKRFQSVLLRESFTADSRQEVDL